MTSTRPSIAYATRHHLSLTSDREGQAISPEYCNNLHSDSVSKFTESYIYIYIYLSCPSCFFRATTKQKPRHSTITMASKAGRPPNYCKPSPSTWRNRIFFPVSLTKAKTRSSESPKPLPPPKSAMPTNGNPSSPSHPNLTTPPLFPLKFIHSQRSSTPK